MIVIIVRLSPFQCVAALEGNYLQSGLSSASSVASSTVRLWDDKQGLKKPVKKPNPAAFGVSMGLGFFGFIVRVLDTQCQILSHKY